MIWTLCFAMIVIFQVFGVALLIIGWLGIVLTRGPRWLKVIFDILYKINGK